MVGPKNFFPFPLFVLLLDPGSRINIPDPQHWGLFYLTWILFGRFTEYIFS